MAIPNWNAHGVLPPIDVADPTSGTRSPYFVSLTDVIVRYANSEARRTILEGFLRHREALDSVGLRSGFQWLDGSFLEDIEVMEGRDPGDIDVVTFFTLPSGVTSRDVFDAAPAVFDQVQAKANYCVDAYFVQLNVPQPALLVRSVTYWYSLWSHRRDDMWRGYLQIDLAPTENAAARANLAAMADTGGTP